MSKSAALALGGQSPTSPKPVSRIIAILPNTALRDPNKEQLTQFAKEDALEAAQRPPLGCVFLGINGRDQIDARDWLIRLELQTAVGAAWYFTKHTHR